MSGGWCKMKNKERGAWYEVQAVKNCIKAKEDAKLDASYEKSLLKAWVKYPEYARYINA